MHPSRWLDALTLGVGAFLGLCACGGQQAMCFGLRTEVDGRPQPGTPRAGYCDATGHWYRWLLFPLIGGLITFAVSRLLHRRRNARWGAVAVAVVFVVAQLWVVAGLGDYTSP